ncbi:MAG: DUF2070 family protein [Candidatus Micrarchaeota archaeon]|nr:DUF2070 family protein [Candidatus Micrarchaeota archaeon]
MQEVKKEVLAITKYFLSLPHPAKTTVAIFIVAFLFGVLLSAAKSTDDWVRLFIGGIEGVIFLAFPSIFSSVALYILRRKAFFRRAVFLGLLTCICYGLFYLLSVWLVRFWQPAENLVYIGFGLAFGMWYFFLKLAFGFRKSAFFLATLQLAIFAAFHLAGGILQKEADLVNLLAKLYLAVFVFLAAIYLMFYFLSLPMKKNLKISSMDALGMFLSQWLYGEKELEEAFEEIGEEVETVVWVATFSGKKNNAIFVVPYVHFGPFGNLGGSEFTFRIAEGFSGLYDKKGAMPEVFVFHGTVTHDFNPVSSKELEKVMSACKNALGRIVKRPAKMAYLECKVGSTNAKSFFFNDSAFLSFSRAPQTTEDINFGLGLAVMEIAKRSCKTAAVVDEHNAETGEISSVEVGNPIGFEILDAARQIFSKKKRLDRFLFACASRRIEAENIGKNGIKLALFKKNATLYSIVLIDANGIVPQFREEILDLLVALGKEKGMRCVGEVMTTDTHQLNTIQGVINPVGTQKRGDIMMLIRQLFYEAAAKLEEVKFGAAEERFKINVFGSGQAVEIAATINGVVAILRLVLPAILVAATAILVWALGKIS